MASARFMQSVTSAGGLFRNVQNSLRLVGSCRTLYSAETLGVDGYEKQRERIKLQFSGMTDKFRTKMQEFSEKDSKNMIFTEDLKNMVHLTESSPEDLQLVLQMMKKFNQQNRHLRFGNYVFGPVVMRMYYHLNDPKSAIEAFNDPELEGFFDQLVSFQVLCDLLYRNQMYQEVLDAFEVIKSKQVHMTKYPRNVTVLVFASLYKLNNVQSYELALKLLTEMKEVGVEPVRRVLTYASALAVNQNAANVGLEILSSVTQPNYVTVRNLKISALADIGRADDALPLLRWSLEFDNPGADFRATVCPDVLEKVAVAFDKLDNKEATSEFQRIHKALTETKQISDKTLEELLNSEIAASIRTTGAPQENFRRQNMERSFRIGQSIDLKPRRNPGYERERRSIQGE